MSPERAAGKCPLLDMALSGVSQYAHLISVDFFGDLNAELLRLLRAPGLPFPSRLQVLLTVADLLRCEHTQPPRARAAAASASSVTASHWGRLGLCFIKILLTSLAQRLHLQKRICGRCAALDVYSQMNQEEISGLSHRVACVMDPRGQGEALNIDRRDFHGELYAALQDFPLRPLLEGAEDAVDPVEPRPTASSTQPAAARLLRLADDVLCGTR